MRTITVARKPLQGSAPQNAQQYSCGAINVDGCRIHSGPSEGGGISGASAFGQSSGWNPHKNRTTEIDRSMTQGRWPVNVILQRPLAGDVDVQSGDRKSAGRDGYGHSVSKSGEGWGMTRQGRLYADSGGASRFFKVIECE